MIGDDFGACLDNADAKSTRARRLVLDLTLGRAIKEAETGQTKPMSEVVSRHEAKYRTMGRMPK